MPDDARRGQLIEAGAQAVFDSEVIGPYDALVDREPVREIIRCALDALLALRDSDGIPVVLGLVAEQVAEWSLLTIEDAEGETYTHFEHNDHVSDDYDGDELVTSEPVWRVVPRLSEDKPAQEEK